MKYHHQYHHHSHDCQHIRPQQKYHKFQPYLQHEWDKQYLHGYHDGSAIIITHLHIVDLIHVADMDETYGTYVDDETLRTMMM